MCRLELSNGGFGRYRFQREPIFDYHVRGESDAWYGDKSQSTLWQENKPVANRLHRTMKPVELVQRAIQTADGRAIFSWILFGGSGRGEVHLEGWTDGAFYERIASLK